MQDHLKERLTGAAILVVVVVLLVPELFHGRAPADGGAATAAAGPPVRSVTIDLGDAAGTRPLTENAPVVTDAPAAAAPAVALPEATPPAPAAEPAGAPAVKSPASPPTKSTATPTVKPVAPAAAKPAPAAPGPSTSGNAAASSTSAPASANSTSNPNSGATQSGWTVQLGSFARRDYADRMVKDAARKGFTVEVAGPDDRGLYRVRSPPRADRAAALALKQKMQASGFKPIVNKTP